MNTLLKSALTVAAAMLTVQASAQITFYEHDDFRGRTFNTQRSVENFRSIGFNDRASSVVVEGGSWEVCDDIGYAGRCVVLQKGSYSSLAGTGLNDRVSSARRANAQRLSELTSPPPMDTVPYEYRRRPNEKLFQARVSSVRSVAGTPEERCWTEHVAATEERDGRNVGRGVLGALIGGVIGHQIGGGTGRDVATAGGAVAGAVVGANSGRDSRAVPSRDIRRCENTGTGTPAYWDVGYDFRGVHHQIQMASAPGPYIDVNRRGEPRQ